MNTITIGTYVKLQKGSNTIAGIVTKVYPQTQYDACRADVMWQCCDGADDLYCGDKYPTYVSKLVLLNTKPARVIKVAGKNFIITAKGNVFNGKRVNLTLGHLFNNGERFND